MARKSALELPEQGLCPFKPTLAVSTFNPASFENGKAAAKYGRDMQKLGRNVVSDH